MSLTRRLAPAAIFLASAIAALAYALAGSWPVSMGLALAGALWFLGRRKGEWVAHAALAGGAAAWAIGLVKGMQPGLALLGVTTLLCAWDLDLLGRRLRGNLEAGAFSPLERQHLRQVGAAAGAGLLLGGLGLVVTLDLSFAAVFFLALFAVVALGKVISAAR